MITSVGSTTTSASTTTSTDNNTLGQQDFLEILIAQLKNQDPTNPVDANDFTSQLTQYSSLEQLMNMNTRLDTLIADVESATGAELAGLIGADVTVDGNTLEAEGSTCNITYSLSASAEKGQVTIYDADGNLADTLDFGRQDAGTNTLAWDCIGVPSGTYTFEVSAAASDGSEVSVTTRATGKVTEVTFKNRTATLRVNGQDVSIDDLISITQASD
jgi:flagellar basal-body rod modification protein FlgD